MYPGRVDGERKTIIVNDGARGASVEAGRPLLFGLMSNGIYIPSACGGKGSCGQCRVCVKGDALAYTDAERSLVAESDRRFGIHLSCQVKVQRDLSIEVPWKHFAARQYAARVTGVRDLTWEIKEVTLQPESQLPFAAGQYIQLFLPGTESAPEPQYRAYSMASSPSSPRQLTLMVRRNPDGVVSPYVCDRLRAGDELAIRGPFGDFCLHDGAREALFIAGGSGLAPIRSMLLSMAEKARQGAPLRAATLYFSGRSRRDLFLLEELAALQSVLRFRFIPVLTNPLPDEPWEGERGGMPAVLNRRLDRLDDHEAYLCGSTGMIDACLRVLQAKGLPGELVFFDKFF